MTAAAPSSSSFGKKTREKKRGPKRNAAPVQESTLIRINQILEQFRESKDEVYSFESNLNNRERAQVHQFCRKMGMKSKSSGSGEQRRVNVYKIRNKQNAESWKERLTSFSFSKDSKEALQELFMQYPPDDHGGGSEISGKRSKKIDKIRASKDDFFRKPSMTKAEVSKMLASISSKEKEPNMRKVFEDRSKLPIASFREVITTTVETHQVVLLSGETGCGKTTQVPQFLLDHIWGKGESCKIVCTQPRRISAISVAERISFERGEDIGDSVGYKIRMESKGGRHSSIVFCTNGILLRILVAKGGGRYNAKASRKLANDDISDITHIIVDEIHERDRYSDFILAIIRDLLPSYPQLRLVLMSATMDAERFSQYFGGCPIICVPGFTHPVKLFYLEDILSILKPAESKGMDSTSSSSIIEDFQLTEDLRAALDDAITLALSSDDFDPLLELISSEGGLMVYNYQHSSTGITPLMVFAGKGRVGDVCMLLSFGANCHLKANDGKTALEWAEQRDHGEAAEVIKKHMDKAFSSSDDKQLLDKYLSEVNLELVDVVLVERLLRKICVDLKDGAILIFLPGWDDINRTREKLSSSTFFKDSSKYLIIPLHSMVPSSEQKLVFKRPPPGCRKIVLSTNIAETAVTIDDVVCVIDSGRMKEKNYDPYNNVSTLHSSWISKASAKQREGRAGRCQPGMCYHLYSKTRAASLPDFQVPEIKRMPIEEICLQVKLLAPNCKIEEFFQKTLDPPVFETICNAIIVLQDIGALTSDEKLTDLGEKLGCLPIHPLTSKMLFFSILLNCLDPALTLACASDYRDPFTIPMLPVEKKKAAATKLELASLYGGRSDQLAVVAAFECWMGAKERGQERLFCSEYFISSGKMKMIAQMRKQLKIELQRNGFLPEDASCCSLNAHEPGILHAVLVAGLYPMVGRLLPPKGGSRSVIETAAGDKVRLHPRSTNFKLTFKKSDDLPLIIFDEITRSDGGLSIRNCSVIAPLPLLLLATEIVVAPAEGNDDDSDCMDSEGDNSDEDQMVKHDDANLERGGKIMSSPENTVKVVVDRWLPFVSTALDVAQIYCLRERLSAAILFKVTHPGRVLPELLAASMHAIACILSYDGLSRLSLPMESIDTLTSLVSATGIGVSATGKNKVTRDGTNNYLRSLIFHAKKSRPPGGWGITNWNNSPTPGSLSVNSHQRYERQASAASGYGKSTYFAPRGDSFKRQRGYGS